MRVVALSFAACLLAASCGAPPAEPGISVSHPAAPKGWFEPTEPARIVDSIHYVGTRELGAYLIATPEGHILIDGAMPESAKEIELSIFKLGFRPELIRLLLITHAHVDHVGTLARFKKLSGAQVAVMAADVELLESGGRTDYLYGDNPLFRFEPVKVDRVLKDGDVVTLGGVSLTARHTPGHTRGCTTWITTVEEGGRFYRTVFLGSTSINPGTRLVRDPSYPGIADDYRRSIALLEALEPDIFVAPHVEFFDFAKKRERARTQGASAYADPDGYRARIASAKANLEAEIAR